MYEVLVDGMMWQFVTILQWAVESYDPKINQPSRCFQMWHRQKVRHWCKLGQQLQPKTSRNVNKIIIFAIPTVVLRNPHLHKTCVTSIIKGSFQKHPPKLWSVNYNTIGCRVGSTFCWCLPAFGIILWNSKKAMHRIYFHHFEYMPI